MNLKKKYGNYELHPQMKITGYENEIWDEKKEIIEELKRAVQEKQKEKKTCILSFDLYPGVRKEEMMELANALQPDRIFDIEDCAKDEETLLREFNDSHHRAVHQRTQLVIVGLGQCHSNDPCHVPGKCCLENIVKVPVYIQHHIVAGPPYLFLQHTDGLTVERITNGGLGVAFCGMDHHNDQPGLAFCQSFQPHLGHVIVLLQGLLDTFHILF